MTELSPTAMTEPNMFKNKTTAILLLVIRIGVPLCRKNQLHVFRPFGDGCHTLQEYIESERAVNGNFTNDFVVDCGYDVRPRRISVYHPCRKDITGDTLDNILYEQPTVKSLVHRSLCVKCCICHRVTTFAAPRRRFRDDTCVKIVQISLARQLDFQDTLVASVYDQSPYISTVVKAYGVHHGVVQNVPQRRNLWVLVAEPVYRLLCIFLS